MPRRTAFILLSCVSACTVPSIEARGSQVFTVPAAGVSQLLCTSHNGAIQITGVADATEVVVHAELSARGFTEAEAEQNLALLRVDHRLQDGQLELLGVAPDDLDWGVAPSFAFRIEAPAALASRLCSHNGQIRAAGMLGGLDLESHNGGISVQGSPPRVAILTHNGSVDARIDGDGPVDGSITSHNGGIDLSLGAGRSAVVEASTANGSLRANRRLTGLRVEDNHLSGTAGEGGGHLEIATHNGDVVIR